MLAVYSLCLGIHSWLTTPSVSLSIPGLLLPRFRYPLLAYYSRCLGIHTWLTTPSDAVLSQAAVLMTPSHALFFQATVDQAVVLFSHALFFQATVHQAVVIHTPSLALFCQAAVLHTPADAPFDQPAVMRTPLLLPLFRYPWLAYYTLCLGIRLCALPPIPCSACLLSCLL